MKLGQKSVHFRTNQLHRLYILLDSYNLTDLEKAVFKSLFCCFSPLVNSCYYKVATFGDGKYSLTIRRDSNDYDIKYSVNPYGNQTQDYSN